MSKGSREYNRKISTIMEVDYNVVSFADIARGRRAEEKYIWKDLTKEGTQFPNDIKESLLGHLKQTARLYEAQFNENHQYYIYFQPVLNEVSNNASWLKGFAGSNIDFFESDYVQSFSEL